MGRWQCCTWREKVDTTNGQQPRTCSATSVGGAARTVTMVGSGRERRTARRSRPECCIKMGF